MGDTCCDNSTMGSVIAMVQEELPGVYVHSIKLGSSVSSDRNAGFLGNLNTQIDKVCEDLSDIKELQGDINMMGFSQGGLFLRALIQRCPSLKTNTLVTFGSPHGGISRIPECNSDGDFMCNWMRQLASRGVYSWYVRDHVVQAQYFKDPERIDQYLKYNIFLPDINSDLGETNEDYRNRISALEKMVLVRFSNDNLISPASSSWFGFVDADGNDVPLHNTTLYSEDRLGLRELDASQRLDFVTLDGKHMNIGETALRSIVSKYLSPEQKADSRQKVMLVQGKYQ
ncbi:hypothetical protein EV179_002099 [Coemansia sp. RSA 487]|nr:hypothetical protein LPJ74_005480 [Coemansia sp. RSA 1843]KAJ2215506.1 hypothetical protein EV179_002099 [Coemansia sp. RSA 487]